MKLIISYINRWLSQFELLHFLFMYKYTDICTFYRQHFAVFLFLMLLYQIHLMIPLFLRIFYSRIQSAYQYIWLSTNVSIGLQWVEFSIIFWQEKIESDFTQVIWWVQSQEWTIRRVFSSLEDYLTLHICYYCIGSRIPNMASKAVMVLFV